LDVQQNRLAEETQGDEGAAKLQEGQMNVGAVLVADLQAPVAVEPGEGQQMLRKRLTESFVLRTLKSTAQRQYHDNRFDAMVRFVTIAILVCECPQDIMIYLTKEFSK
jgi:hypothetical protein